MVKISDVLIELKIQNWTLDGEPKTEAEFKKSFRKVTGEDSNGSAILTDDESKFGVTWSQIKTKKTELETADYAINKSKIFGYRKYWWWKQKSYC